MPSYDRRKQEVRERFNQAQANLQPLEIVRIAAVLEDFYTTRDAFLTTVVTVVADDGDEELAGDYKSKFETLTRQVEDKLGDMLSGLSEVSEAAVKFREQVLVEEVRFHYTLAAANPCAARDALLGLERRLREMVAVLKEKWLKLTEEDYRVLEIEWQAAARINQIVKTAIEQEIPVYLRLGNAVADGIDDLGKLPDAFNDALIEKLKGIGIPEEYAKLLPKVSSIGKDTFEEVKKLGIPAKEAAKGLEFLARDPGMWLSDTFKDMFGNDLSLVLRTLSEATKGLIVLQGAYAEQLRAFKDALPGQGGILVALSKTPRDVDEFIKSNGVDVARAQRETALRALERLGSEPATDGLRGDGAEVDRAMAEALNKRMETITEVFDDFVSQFKGEFLGSISDETEQALLRSGSWQEQVAGMEGLGLDEKLRQWRSSTLEVSSKLTGAYSQVQAHFAGFPIEMQDKLRRAVNDEWQKALDAIRGGTEEVKTTLDAAEQAVKSEQIRKDVDRSALVAQLRG